MSGPGTPFSILERIELGETAPPPPLIRRFFTFSILERIELGETHGFLTPTLYTVSFSILERIELGETWCWADGYATGTTTFSILERIELGETSAQNLPPASPYLFQYPRTDRIG